MVVYPMLLAQFIEIVHELKPPLVGAPPLADLVSGGHFLPVLLCVGYLLGRCSNICKAYPAREIHVKIEDQFDRRILSLRSRRLESPLLV